MTRLQLQCRAGRGCVDQLLQPGGCGANGYGYRCCGHHDVTMIAAFVGLALAVRKPKVMSVCASGAVRIKPPAVWPCVIEAGKPTKALLLKFSDYSPTPVSPDVDLAAQS